MVEMREHPERAFPTEDIARRLNVNLLQINHLFKQATGLPPHAWLMSLRIARAKKLLDQDGASVQKIAHDLGYHSSQYFATQFKKETGHTPRDWRTREANCV